MKLWAALRDATRGWSAIVAGRGNWRDFFSLTAPGLVTALFIYFFIAFLAIAIGSIENGMPAIVGVLIELAVQGLSVLALLVAVLLTRAALKSQAEIIAFMVPGIYALVFYLVAGTILAAIGLIMLTLAFAGLGYLLFRLARMAGGWTIGVSVAFAVFTIVLLVGMPMTLYMLSSPAASPT